MRDLLRNAACPMCGVDTRPDEAPRCPRCGYANDNGPHDEDYDRDREDPYP